MSASNQDAETPVPLRCRAVTTIAEFVAARLDEDEAAAKAATLGPWREDGMGIRGAPIGAPAAPSIRDTLVVKHAWPQEAAHVLRHDPSRVLRQVEADRRLLLRWHKLEGRRGDNAEDEARAWLMDSVLADRAAVWCGHPDYQEEWKP